MTQIDLPAELQKFMEQFSQLLTLGSGMPAEDSPMGKLTRQFFANNWRNCQEGLLRKTNHIHIWPEPSPAPRTFRFEIDCPYKRQRGPEAPVELVPGPIRGTVYYRPDLFTNADDPAVAVALDRDQSLLHPNYSRQKGFICLGELPSSQYPFPLDLLFENLVYPIVSYQQKRPVHPFDVDAARYFALDPDAMQGLEPAAPLY
jgi:hypothetical protein